MPKKKPSDIKVPADPIDRFVYFIKERYDVYIKKTKGDEKPWTKDPILQTYRFCNVYRELDKVTVWITRNWREPHHRCEDLWFAMAVARFINWPDSLEAIGFPVPWNPDHFKDVLEKRKEAGKQVFTGAYIVSSQGPKIAYVADQVLSPLWKAKEITRPIRCDRLEDFYERILRFKGLGSFMAAQIVADVKYIPSMIDAEDWWDFAVPGPGSKRGLNRVLGFPKRQPWTDNSWRKALKKVASVAFPELDELPRLHAQDLQNCLCEFDKYERVRLGEGRPRSLYPGAK